MSQLAPLTCPNCGSSINREEKKCSYCGAELVLLRDGSSFRFKSQIACPKCGAFIEKSAWFCMNCFSVLTEDIEMLKEVQKKVSFEQEKWKNKISPRSKQSLSTRRIIVGGMFVKIGFFMMFLTVVMIFMKALGPITEDIGVPLILLLVICGGVLFVIGLVIGGKRALAAIPSSEDAWGT